MDERVYLCTICGLFIKSSITHLRRHEKLHGEIIRRVKCLNIKCNKSFSSKGGYFLHWCRCHTDSEMPDKIEYIDESPKARRNLKKNPVRENRFQLPIVLSDLDNLELVQLNVLKLEDVILTCLKREPEFGRIIF